MSSPTWIRRPAVVWVSDAGDADPNAPVGAMILTGRQALDATRRRSLSASLRELRARGATVKTTPDASPETKAAARQLRSRLSTVNPARLAEVARDIGEPDLSEALSGWPAHVPVTFETLANATRDNDRAWSLSRTARLLLALEHL